jgi:2-polyprenyl-3-methyl-5-hydroxy-6-metoxy-1,4-benzoquinol methylase
MWDERYAETGFAYGKAPNDFLVDVERLFPRGARVLSLAEGEGRNAVWLAGQGHDVVGVDQSSVGLTKARALAAERGVAIATVLADLSTFSIDEGAWDVIVSLWAHMPPPARAGLHARVVAGLKPGGLFVLEAYAPGQTQRSTGGPREPERCMTAKTLREELAGLTFVRCLEGTRFVHEGRYHDGDSDVVQVLARR